MLSTIFKTNILLCLAVTAPTYVVSADTEANCTFPQYNWMFNSLGLSPCHVAGQLFSPCIGGFLLLPPTRDNSFYPSGSSNQCGCSTVVYSLVSACAVCQGALITKWSDTARQCPTTWVSTFPKPFPSGTRVPSWAFLPIAPSYDLFNEHAASAAGGLDLTANPSSTPSSPTPTLSSPPSPVSSPPSSSSSLALVSSASSNTSTPSLTTPATGSTGSLSSVTSISIAGNSSVSDSSMTSTEFIPSITSPSFTISSHLPIMAIAGGVVGGIVGLALVGAAYCCYRRNAAPRVTPMPYSGPIWGLPNPKSEELPPPYPGVVSVRDLKKRTLLPPKTGSPSSVRNPKCFKN